MPQSHKVTMENKLYNPNLIGIQPNIPNLLGVKPKVNSHARFGGSCSRCFRADLTPNYATANAGNPTQKIKKNRVNFKPSFKFSCLPSAPSATHFCYACCAQFASLVRRRRAMSGRKIAGFGGLKTAHNLELREMEQK